MCWLFNLDTSGTIQTLSEAAPSTAHSMYFNIRRTGRETLVGAQLQGSGSVEGSYSTMILQPDCHHRHSAFSIRNRWTRMAHVDMTSHPKTMKV